MVAALAGAAAAANIGKAMTEADTAPRVRTGIRRSRRRAGCGVDTTGAPRAGGAFAGGEDAPGIPRHRRHIRHTRQPSPTVLPLSQGLSQSDPANYTGVLPRIVRSSELLPVIAAICHTSCSRGGRRPATRRVRALTRVPGMDKVVSTPAD